MALTAPGIKLKFVDLTGEVYRTYTFPGYDEVMITGSISGAVDRDGGHFLLDIGGKAHYIPPSFIHLEWETTDPKFRWESSGK
jgi:hypothetical protein